MTIVTKPVTEKKVDKLQEKLLVVSVGDGVVSVKHRSISRLVEYVGVVFYFYFIVGPTEIRLIKSSLD